ncbi:hypothetical protein J1614_004820 [Plenodomus biglobosus]|nr:hypothetical protein J1614_004820 [Plenodomus biglobosus]
MFHYGEIQPQLLPRSRLAAGNATPGPSTNSQLAPLSLHLQPAISVASSENDNRNTMTNSYLSPPNSPRKRVASTGPSLQRADGTTVQLPVSQAHVETSLLEVRQRLTAMWAANISTLMINSEPLSTAITRPSSQGQRVSARPRMYESASLPIQIRGKKSDKSPRMPLRLLGRADGLQRGGE